MTPDIEQQFLPAVLEIQETPPSPLGRAIIWVIALFFVSSLLWAYKSHIDIVAIATGKIIPNGHVKIIQPLGIGTVTAIHVKEGQAVNKNDSLVELDDSTINAKITQLVSEQNYVTQQSKRLAKLFELQHIKPTKETAKDDPILHSQWLEYNDRLNTLKSQKNKRQAEFDSVKQQAKKLEAILPLISQRSSNEKQLVDKNLFPKQKYLETEERRITTLYDLKSQNNRVQELQQTIAEIDSQINHIRSDFTKKNLEKREETKQKLSNIQQELIKLQIQKKALNLTAPINGIVQQLIIHTIGGIVTPAQELMIIVPQSVKLEIEAVVENKDIGFVHEGQSVSIKLDAFPFTKYGVLNGRITDLSDDAISDKDRGLIYKARISMEDKKIQVNDKYINLSPGMTASVEIKTGQRRLIEFFLAPLLKYKDESIRER